MILGLWVAVARGGGEGGGAGGLGVGGGCGVRVAWWGQVGGGGGIGGKCGSGGRRVLTVSSVVLDLGWGEGTRAWIWGVNARGGWVCEGKRGGGVGGWMGKEEEEEG